MAKHNFIPVLPSLYLKYTQFHVLYVILLLTRKCFVIDHETLLTMKCCSLDQMQFLDQKVFILYYCKYKEVVVYIQYFSFSFINIMLWVFIRSGFP